MLCRYKSCRPLLRESYIYIYIKKKNRFRLILSTRETSQMSKSSRGTLYIINYYISVLVVITITRDECGRPDRPALRVRQYDSSAPKTIIIINGRTFERSVRPRQIEIILVLNSSRGFNDRAAAASALSRRKR